ncbi:MAG: hypothetical protein ABFC91_04925 [Methanobacteriaceae archaeon]
MSRITRLKTDLLCKGIRVDPTAPYAKEIVPEAYAEGGKSRAGVAGSGKSFILDHQEPCNIGVLQPFLEESPYQFKIIDNQGWILKDGEKVIKATLREPAWHKTPYADQIQLHGKDSLATALSNFCTYKKEGQGCKFCIIDIGNQVVFRHPQQVARSIGVIEEKHDLRASFNIEDKYNPDLTDKDILKRKIYIEPKDININAGALNNAAKIYQNNISEIRKVSKLPISIEIGPIGLEEIENLHSAGTDAASFNLEVYDQKMRKEVIPGKARKNPLEKYLSSMKNAVDVLGENQVSSWILIGLEPPEKTIEGIRKIAETGAIPLPKPFRPLYSAEYENKKPPKLEDAILIYGEWLDAIRECGLNPLKAKAGCARCNACFPIKELLRHGI